MDALNIFMLCVCIALIIVNLGLWIYNGKTAAKRPETLSPVQVPDALERKIKIMRLDLEQAQEEAQRLREKIKFLNTSNSELEEEIDKQKRLSRTSAKNLEEEYREIEFLKRKLSKSIEAHKVIEEILKAEPAEQENPGTATHNFDTLLDYISGPVRDSLTTAEVLTTEEIHSLFGKQLNEWAAQARKSWLRGKTAIAFIGEFSAGKTSIVNRILALDNSTEPLLPVDTRPSTAVPTYITGGASPHFCFVNQAGVLREISEDTFRRITKEALQHLPGITDLIQYFVLSLSNPLPEDISILDTPGFSSNASEDAARTVSVINECDALLWVVDVNTGALNSSSIRILKENLSKPLYIIINKTNTKSEGDIDAVEEDIKLTLEKEGLEYKGIVRFSKDEPVQKILDVITGVGCSKERESYIHTLIKILERAISVYEERIHTAQLKANSLEAAKETLRNKFSHTLRKLHENCENVANIPHKNRRILRENDYRLSLPDFTLMVDLLNEISVENYKALSSGYGKQMEISAELSAAWEEHTSLRSILINLRKCLDDLRLKLK